MRILLFLLFTLATLFQQTWAALPEDRDSIYVQLESDVQLLPLYMGKMQSGGGGFDSGYLDRLGQILNFDLASNGMTAILPTDAELEVLMNKDKEGRFSSGGQQWKKRKVQYAVWTKVQDKKLSARVYTVSNNTLKSIDDIELTGNLSQDRRQIHLLADTIHKALFNKEGIATTRILYTLKKNGVGTKQFISDIWEADYDGANPRQITREGYCVTPVYVPPKPGVTSGSMFYVSYQNGQPKIFYASLKDGIGHRLTLMRGNQLMPAISRQRDKVAFICDSAGNPDLFIQAFTPENGPEGKPRQIYTSRLGVQGSPAFSPDGERIAFVSNKDGSARIYVMEIPSPGVRLQDIKPKMITKQSRESTAPAWSPDGTKLAYCAMTQNVRQIWIYDFETGRERQLTQGPGHKENPAWGPNSLHLVFNSTGPGGSELYLVNLNQPQAKQITAGEGEKHYPSWEPKN